MKKDLLILGFVALIIAVLISGTEIQSVEEYYLTHIDDITPESETVSLEIRCDTVLPIWDSLPAQLREEGYLPKDGVILEKTELVLREGDTVFDILDRAARNYHIQMEYQGADANVYKSVYVQGISYLYEYTCGPLSGWNYQVNGSFPGTGCSQYTLKDGDSVLWAYTCDLGRDIGNEWEAAA